MEIKTYVLMAVSVITAVVVFGACLPVFADTTQANDTFDNTDGAYYNMVNITDETEYTLTWDHTKPTVAIVNDEEVDLIKGTTIISDGGRFLMRYGQDGTGYYIQSVPGSTINVIVYSSGTNTADLDITVASGTISVEKTLISDNTTSTVTTTVNDGFAIAKSGDWVLKSPSQSAYVLEDSRIYAMGLTTIANVWYNGFYLDGTVENMTVTQYNPDPATYTISNVSVNTEEVDSHVDLYTLDSITFLATQIEDSTITNTCTYNYIIVPSEVVAERSVHPTGATLTLMELLPVLIGAGLVIGVVGAAIVRRL